MDFDALIILTHTHTHKSDSEYIIHLLNSKSPNCYTQNCQSNKWNVKMNIVCKIYMYNVHCTHLISMSIFFCCFWTIAFFEVLFHKEDTYASVKTALFNCIFDRWLVRCWHGTYAYIYAQSSKTKTYSCSHQHVLVFAYVCKLYLYGMYDRYMFTRIYMYLMRFCLL